MKRVAIIVLIVASSACASLSKGGARGPNIQRTNDTTTQPSDPSPGSVEVRTDLAR